MDVKFDGNFMIVCILSHVCFRALAAVKRCCGLGISNLLTKSFTVELNLFKCEFGNFNGNLHALIYAETVALSADGIPKGMQLHNISNKITPQDHTSAGRGS